MKTKTLSIALSGLLLLSHAAFSSTAFFQVKNRSDCYCATSGSCSIEPSKARTVYFWSSLHSTAKITVVKPGQAIPAPIAFTGKDCEKYATGKNCAVVSYSPPGLGGYYIIPVSTEQQSRVVTVGYLGSATLSIVSGSVWNDPYAPEYKACKTPTHHS